jgi:DNA-binding transcriptional LysR family regulator
MNENRLSDAFRLSVLLSVARAGSPSSAAKLAGAQPATLYRQIDAMETAAGTRLFVRQRGQWTLTPLGRKLVDIAAELDRKLIDFNLAAAAQNDQAAGLLRVTASDAFANFYLAQKLAGFAAAAPGIAVELIVTNKRIDLAKGEADLAIRPHSQPGDGLVGRRAGRITHAVFAADSYLETRSGIKLDRNLTSHDILAYGRDMSHFDAAQWTAQLLRGRNPIGRFNDLTSMARAVEGGLGIAVLPLFVGRQLNKTQCIAPAGGGLPADIWLLCHESQRKNAKVKAFLRHFAEEIRRDAGQFDG